MIDFSRKGVMVTVREWLTRHFNRSDRQDQVVHGLGAEAPVHGSRGASGQAAGRIDLRRTAFIAAAVAATCLDSHRAIAQQPAAVQETVIVTATASAETLGNVGRPIAIVSGDELRKLGVGSFADALRLVAAVGVRSRGAFGVQSDLSIRGAAFGQTLVLVNGVRLNDAQSGHHNSDIPVPIGEIERIEVLLGAGSSLHGADATGGTVNIITRQGGGQLLVDASVGQHGLVEASGTLGRARGGLDHVFSGSLSRSDGFMPTRDHNVRLARYQATFQRDTTVTVGVIDKAFGANGFYGPAPSREWTEQLLATVHHRYARSRRWQGSADASYRRHGDRFIYDEGNPTRSQNTHRTRAIAANVRWHGMLSETMQLNLAAGAGRDIIESSNLGDHAFSRASLAAELRHSLGARVTLHPGIRVDTYTGFGTSWNPAVAVSGWISDRVRLRASAGRAFRVPTFTELFYTDPNHEAAGALSPETAWSTDAGTDLFARSWTVSAAVFTRKENNIIDWVRPSSAVRWRTANIREGRARGFETSVKRRWEAGAQAGIQYMWLESEAPALDLLSKYVLDGVRHSLAASATGEWRNIRLGSRAEWRRRSDGPSYWIVDVRVGLSVGRVEPYAQTMNLLDARYQEIRGVEMPGRWIKVGVRLR